VASRSRQYTHYRLRDAAAVRQALTMAVAGPVGTTASIDLELPADLFDVVEGLEGVKHKLRLALEADRPVHVLLVGPPASAKTVLLDEIARLEGSRYALGGTTTRSGLVSYLLGEPGCRRLVIDEQDKMDGRDLSALLSVMETGRVTRLQHGRWEQERRLVWVFGGANRDAQFPRELLDRYLRLELEPYGEDEFRRVVAAVLERREQCDPELAREIAQLTATRTNSVRDAVRIARMARGDRRLARQLVEEVL
jgi:Holliday junction DNA helicase RuvB